MKRGTSFFRLLITLAMFIAMNVFLHSTLLMAQDYRSFIESGDKYYEQFDNFGALEEYEKAYQLSPDSYDALMKLTRAYNDVGEDLKDSHSDEADEYIKKAARYAELLQKKFPDSAESYFFLASAYGKLALLEEGKEKVRLASEVEKNCKKAIELDPGFIPAYIALGVYYREVAELDWFLKAFARAISEESLNGTNEDSKRMLLKAMVLNPQIPRVHFELAKTYKALEENDKAIEQFRKVTELPVLDHQDFMIKAKAEKELRELELSQLQVSDRT